MPRRKQPYALAEDGDGGLVPVPAVGGSSRVPDVPGVPKGKVSSEQANTAMEWLSQRTDGWLRYSPDKNGIAIHAKWKFNSSKWPNHYVYYRVDRGHWSEVIVGIAWKVSQVDEGLLKPTFDTWYGEQ